MKLLLITNLYPPQELGGYGRSMADFAWGLRELGHTVKVICSNASYLDPQNNSTNDSIQRNLLLKGSFKDGVTHISNLLERRRIDEHNNQVLKFTLENENWDGVLIGNIDLIEHEILKTLTITNLPVIHHIGFITPPFDSIYVPSEKNYKIVSASKAVRESLVAAGFARNDSNVIYPGARVELFGESVTGRKLPNPPDGSSSRPLCIAFAGLLMETKGLHVLAEAIVKLHYKGISSRTLIAGGTFQKGYQQDLEYFLDQHNLKDSVTFTGRLDRSQLARFFRLSHVFVFPSIFPEAFGIVQAEAMASGLTLISSGVGGSKELVEHGVNGLLFNNQDSDDLCDKLHTLSMQPDLIKKFGEKGEQFAREKFSTMTSAKKLENLFRE